MKMHSCFCEQLAVVALTVMISALAFGQAAPTPAQPNIAPGVPRLVKFRGLLKDASGNLLANTVGITFAVCSEQTGGVPLWQETHNVQFAQGRYTVFLGESTSEYAFEGGGCGHAGWLASIALRAQPAGERRRQNEQRSRIVAVVLTRRVSFLVGCHHDGRNRECDSVIHHGDEHSELNRDPEGNRGCERGRASEFGSQCADGR